MGESREKRGEDEDVLERLVAHQPVDDESKHNAGQVSNAFPCLVHLLMVCWEESLEERMAYLEESFADW